MTAQITERISLSGHDCSLCTEPLNSYFELSGEKLPFAASSTALWRGYVGSWELLNDRLYLVGLSGTLVNGTEATLETFFPNFPNRVFAHWFSGKVRIPLGRLLQYVHGGYGSTYERDLFILFQKGIAIKSVTRINGIKADQSVQEGYVTAAMTTFYNQKGDKGTEK